MKANAPEKIYIPTAGDEIHYHMTCPKNEFKESIEYTRTDAFIEIACDAYCAVCDTKECRGCADCSWVIKFRRQLMKLIK